MARIPFARQSYALDSLPASAQRLVNLYPEQLPPEARAPWILRSTPGLAPVAACGPGYVRAMEAAGGKLLVVSGDQVWRWTEGEPAPTMLGNVGTGGPATVAVGATHAVVCTPPRAWAYRYDTGAFTEIPQGDGYAFPGASSVCWLDGYFVFTKPGTGEFFASALENPGVYDALDFATAEGVPDVLVRAVADHNELWLFGQGSVEVWYDAGDADFPFRRMAGGVLRPGCVSAASVAKLDNGLVWLGQDGIVYRAQGLQPQRISTHAMERALAGYGGLGDATALATSHDGHQFYVLTVPGAPAGNGGGLGATWAYDAATGLWHERASAAGGTGRWLGNAAAQFGQVALVGDGGSGTLFRQARDLGTDNGVVVSRIATLPPLWADGRRAAMHRLELELETGAPGGSGTVLLDWSDDGGRTWTAPRPAATGLPGDTAQAPLPRAAWTRLGLFRQRVLRFSTTGRCTLYAADAVLEERAT